MKTIPTILQEMREAIEANQVIAPTKWLDWAFSLNTLWDELKIALIKAEVAYNGVVIAKMVEQPKLSQIKANTLATQSPEYLIYMELKARDKIIESYIMLSKKRATIEQSF